MPNNCHARLTWRLLSALIILLMNSFLLSLPVGAQDKKADEPKTDAPKTDKAEQDEDTPLPKKDEMLRNLPSKADLLTKPPVDWVILKKDEVLVVKPISPRPRTLEFFAAKRKEFSQPPKLTRMTGEANDAFFARQRKAAEESRKQHEKFEFLEVELPDSTKVSEEQDDTSYKLKIELNIAEVIHHEDLVLRRIDALLEKNELEDAYELLQILDRQNHGWPGWDERLNRFMLIDAQGKLARKEPELAFALLEQMHVQIKQAINSKDLSVRYPTMGADLAKCSVELGKVADALIEPAAKGRDFRQVRFHLARLLKLEPEHPAGAKWKDRMVAETNRTLNDAAQASAANQHDQAALLADQASLIWPATPSLKNAHRQFAQRWQSLKVGVVDVPSTNYPFPTEADRRREKLMRLPLFEPVRIDGAARYRSRFLDNWEPTDLGRQAVFTLRPNRSPWESVPVLTASGAVTALLERLKPNSPYYDERLASFIDGIEVRGPFEFSVKFSRIPVRTEALFAMPLGTDEATSAELDQRIRVSAKTDASTVLRRSVPEGDKSLQRHIAEIAEVKYSSHDKAVQGLFRGEVSMLPNVPVWQLDQLTKDGRFFVRKYALPQTHFVQFNPKSKALRSSELRRAMLYAVDRGQILREIVLRDLTVRTLRLTVPKAVVPVAKIPADSGLTYDEPKGELVWTGLSMNDAQLRLFLDLSPDLDYRKALQTLFKTSQPDRGRVVSAPFGTNLMSYNPVALPRNSDPSLAFALAMAAKKTLGGQLPKLRMICEAEPVCEAAAKRLIEEWRKVDIKVELVTLAPPAQVARPKADDRLPTASGQDTVATQPTANAAPANLPADAEPWDIVYRTGRIPEPMMELWPLLSLDTVARLQSVRYLPDWLRQGLIDLDRTSDWSTTVSTVQELHRQLADTVQLIPLWELDDAIVFRKTIRGIPDAPLHTYQDFELWISEPWYSTDSQ